MTQERKPRFTSLSGFDIARVYSADDLKGWNPETDLGRPGESPYTRGVYPTMYRGRLWTMRQFAGFGTAEDTNRRFTYLLQHGQTGLSVAFDLPTLMGLDSDDPRARGEVGYCAVAITSLEDIDRLFDRIPLAQVTTSGTINGPAAVLFAMYLAVAERRGIPFERLGGTLQNDILKEYIAQKEWLFPPEPHLRLIVDTISYCAKQVPKWHPVSISGYHSPAADEQRRPHHAAGAGGSVGRDPVAPHQLDGRDPGSTDRRGGQAGAQDPTNHRARERGHEHRGSARGSLLRRVADEPSGRRGPRVLPKTRRDGRHGPRDRAGIPPTRNIERVAALPAGSGTERADRRRRQRVRGAGRAAHPDPEDRAGGGEGSSRSAGLSPVSPRLVQDGG